MHLVRRTRGIRICRGDDGTGNCNGGRNGEARDNSSDSTQAAASLNAVFTTVMMGFPVRGAKSFEARR